jgi:hypothetical protein
VTETVGVKAGRNNCFVSHAAENSRLNGSQRILFPFVDTFGIHPLFHLKYLDEFFANSYICGNLDTIGIMVKMAKS